MTQYSTIKFDSAEMVREFRRKEILRQAQDDRPTATFQPYRVLPQRRPSFIRRFFYRINWHIAFEWAVWAGMIMVWIVLAILVYAPFVAKIVWQ
jgi:hypothetical protein